MMKKQTIMDEEANYRKAIRLQAKIPTVVTAFARIRKGLRASCTKNRFKLCSKLLIYVNW